MSNDVKNIEELYINYKPKIYGYFYYQTGNSHIAEELCQEVFLKAFKALPTYRGNASLKTWLYSIAHNLYVTWYRREIKYQFNPIDEGLESEDDSPEVSALKSEQSRRVRELLSKLKEDYRTVLILSDIHELSYAEIAAALQWSLSKVKITIYRARMKFKSDYGREEYEYEMHSNP